MVRILIVVVSLWFLMACTDKIDQLIPEDATRGSAAILDFNGEPTIKRGLKGVRGTFVVERDIRPEQVKPTALAALKILKKQNLPAQWFYITIVNDPLMTACSLYVARVEYDETKGEITVTGGLPSDAEIKKWNDGIGKPIEGLPGEIYDMPLLRRPTKEDLQFEHDFCVARANIEKEMDPEKARDYVETALARIAGEGATGMGDDDPEDELYRSIARELGVKFSDVKKRIGVSYFYNMHENDQI